MASSLLPPMVSVRKSLQKSATYSGELPAESWQVLVPAVEHLESVTATIIFGIPENESRGQLEIDASAVATMICQRCLGDMAVRLEARSTLSMVRHDEEAKHRLKDIEPLVIDGDELDLHALVVEELSLQIPVVAKHQPNELTLCNQQLDERIDEAESSDYLSVNGNPELMVGDKAAVPASSSQASQSVQETKRPFAELGKLLAGQDSAGQEGD